MYLGGFAGRIALVLSMTATPVVAQTVVTDAEGLRELAALSIAEENWSQARALAEALLLRNPDDLSALTMPATAAFQLRDFTAARAAAARIYRSSAPQSQRYEAARLAALAAANDDRFTLSEIWLRRALIVAPTEADVAQTTEDAARVRRANPWSTSVQLSFAPSTNINGGATSELNIVDGVPIVGLLSPSAQALKGFVAVADIATSYTLNETRTERQRLTARLYARAPIPVGEDLQAIWDEGVHVDEFATARVELSFNHDQALEDGLMGFDIFAGLVWSGITSYEIVDVNPDPNVSDFQETANRTPDYAYVRLAGDRTFRFPDNMSLTVGGSAEQRVDFDLIDNGQNGVDIERGDLITTIYGSITNEFAGLGQGTATLSATKRWSDSVQYASNSYTAQVGFAPFDRFGPAQVSAAVGVTYSHYPDYIVFVPVPGGRADTRLFTSLTATFPDYSFAGFSPILQVEAGTTASNVSRFELNDLGIEFGFRSTF